uniref:Biogenesis of lysosome-related organelles complex 1 subunit 3 n=1 Tax=Plectus sambesii TaxID=2011161 RepID=A0A914VV46_9BILA
MASLSSAQQQQQQQQRHAIVIPGEADETDDDEEAEEDDDELFDSAHGGEAARRPPALRRADSEPADGDSSSAPRRQQSVLHRKLRETVAALGADAQAFGARQCQTLGKDLQQVSHNVADTQRTLQDTLYRARSIAEVVYRIESQLGTVLSTVQLFPELKLADYPGIEKSASQQSS